MAETAAMRAAAPLPGATSPAGYPARPASEADDGLSRPLISTEPWTMNT